MDTVPRSPCRDYFLGDIPLGTVTLVKSKPNQWTGCLQPGHSYIASRHHFQGGLEYLERQTDSDPGEFVAAFAQARFDMQRLGLRLEEDDGQLIETTEILVADYFPRDAPEDFFAQALIAMVIVVP